VIPIRIPPEKEFERAKKGNLNLCLGYWPEDLWTPHSFLICFFSNFFFFNLDWIFFDHHLFLKTRQFDNLYSG